MHVIIAVLFTVPHVAAKKKDLVIYCSDDCMGKFSGRSVEGSENHSTSQFCDVSENVPTPWKTHIPGPKADLQHVDWYVEEKQPGHRQLAINITWSEKGYWVDRKLKNGYFLQIVPSDSFNVKYNVIVKVKNYLFSKKHSRPRYRKVYFNYKCYGLSEATLVTPGKSYLVVLKTLPVSPQNLDHLFDAAIVTMPDCNDDSVKDTRNCKPPEETLVSSTIVTFATSNYSQSSFTEVPCCHGYHLYILCGLGGLLLCAILYLGYLLRKQSLSADLPIDKHVMILIDNRKTNQAYAKAGDELARLLKFAVQHVTFSLWHETEISQIGLLDWMSKCTPKVDSIIVLCPHNLKADKTNRKNKSIGCCSGIHATVSGLAMNNCELRYCAVHLGKKHKHSTCKPHCYTLPHDCLPLLKLLSVPAVPAKFHKSFKQRIGYWANEVNKENEGPRHKQLDRNADMIQTSSISSNVEIEYVCSL